MSVKKEEELKVSRSVRDEEEILGRGKKKKV